VAKQREQVLVNWWGKKGEREPPTGAERKKKGGVILEVKKAVRKNKLYRLDKGKNRKKTGTASEEGDAGEEGINKEGGSLAAKRNETNEPRRRFHGRGGGGEKGKGRCLSRPNK